MRKAFLFCVALSLLVYDRGDATINLLVSTYDGFVIAADSRVTLSEKKKHRIASDSYQKIFRIGKSVGVACSGAAFLYDENGDRRNVGSIVDAYKIRNDLTETTFVSPKEAADSLRKIVEELYDKQPMNLGEGAVHLWVFGYDEEKERKIFEVTLQRDSLEVHGVLEERYAKGTPGSLVGGANRCLFPPHQRL